MSYYLFNRQEILQKVKKTYSKEKTVEYYIQNKEGCMFLSCHVCVSE